MVPVRKAETLKLKAEAELAAAERAIASAASPEAKQQAEDAKAKVAAQDRRARGSIGRGQSRAATKARCRGSRPRSSHSGGDARASSRPRRHARRRATSSRYPSLSAARPSAFMSAKPFSPYWRYRSRFRMPIVRSARISSPRWNATSTDIRWSVVSFVGGRPGGRGDDPNGLVRKGRDRDVVTTDSEGAKAALDRITIPQDTLDFIAERVSPRSSLIISDEALSSETGKGTEFVVTLSGEPQGGLKYRRPSPRIEVRLRSFRALLAPANRGSVLQLAVPFLNI